MKYVEKWGDSIDIAVDLALADLGMTREQVTVTVLEEPSRGFFGIGSKLAKVRVEESGPQGTAEQPAPAKAEKVEVASEVKEVKEEASQGAAPQRKPRREREEAPAREKPPVEKAASEKPAPGERKQVLPDRIIEYKKEGNQEIVIEVCGVDDPRESCREERVPRERRSRRSDQPARQRAPRRQRPSLNERPADLREDGDNPAKAFLDSIAANMGLDVSIQVLSNADSVFADIDGADSGTMIGKRGTTLDALQYLTSLVVNKNRESYRRVIIDAEGYRLKREATLSRLAARLADKVTKSGRSVRLEPMNPYERKVIHTALQDRQEVQTRSEGEEPYRRVIIEPRR